MADSEGAVAPVEPAGGTPGTWRIGRFAVASGLVISAAVHLVVIAPAVILTSRLLRSDPAQSVEVDIVTAQQLAEISKPTLQPDKPPPPPPPSQPPASQVASASPLATPLPSTLAGLPLLKDGGASDVQADLTADDIRAFAEHVQRCWAAPAGAAKASDVYVLLRVRLGRDGSLAAEPTLQGGSASKAAQALAVANSAKHALRKCTPYSGLPVAKYDEWHVLDLRFTPSGLTTASTVPAAPPAPGSG
jgi:hypothetical protein